MVSPKLVAASSVPMILSILSHGESYGYAILQRVKALSGGELEWTEGMLYPVLHRLERERHIRAHWGKSPEGRRRKYYALAQRGSDALARERSEWEAVDATLRMLWGGGRA